MRVVADTNIIISMLVWGKSLQRLFRLINTRKVTLAFSPATMDELFRVITYPHIQRQTEKLAVPIERLIDKLLAASAVVYPTLRITAIRSDPTDNRVLEVAIASQAEYIISGDTHLLKAKRIDGIPIITARKFLELF